jgi:hypothetical protein
VIAWLCEVGKASHQDISSDLWHLTLRLVPNHEALSR